MDKFRKKHQVGNAVIMCSNEVREFKNVIVARHGIVLDENFRRIPAANQQFNFWSALWAEWWEPATWLPDTMMEVPFKPIIELPQGDYIYALFYQDKTAFGHFWDILQSLHEIEEQKIQGTLLHNYQTDMSDVDFHWSAFGYSANRRMPLDVIRYNYFVPTLYVSTLPVPPAELHPELKNWLQGKYTEAVYQEDPPLSRRLYLSRSKAVRRRVQNEPQLLPILESYGFTILNGDEGIREHITCFRSATVIVGCIGSLFRNIFFCEQSPKIIEYCSERYEYDDSIQRIAKHVGIKEYHRMTVPDDGYDTITIDPTKFEEALIDLGLDKVC